MKMDQETLKRRLKKHNFFHTIQLGNGIVTPGRPLPRHKKLVLEAIATHDLDGKRVLDVACANGLFAIEAERHGATEILAVDHTERMLKPLRNLLIPYLKSKIEVLCKNLLDLRSSEIGQFDIIIFPGVLYHLRYPFWSLKIIKDLLVEDGLLILETAVMVDDNRHAMLWCPSPADSPHRARGANSCSFFNAKALRETLGGLGIDVIEFHYSRRTHAVKIRRAYKRLRQTFRRAVRFGNNKPRRSGPKLERVVLVCRRKSALVDRKLQEFYEDTC